MEADPLYPIQVNYPVAQDVWELFEVHIWNAVMVKIGKSRAFQYFHYRHEKVKVNFL